MWFNLLSFQERIQNHSFLFWNQNEKTAISSERQTFVYEISEDVRDGNQRM